MPKLRHTCISLSIVDIDKQNAPADVMDKKDYFIRLTLSLSLLHETTMIYTLYDDLQENPSV